mgnify:CR=1 FL=1
MLKPFVFRTVKFVSLAKHTNKKLQLRADDGQMFVLLPLLQEILLHVSQWMIPMLTITT